MTDSPDTGTTVEPDPNPNRWDSNLSTQLEEMLTDSAREIVAELGCFLTRH